MMDHGLRTPINAGSMVLSVLILTLMVGHARADDAGPAGHWEGAITLPGTELGIKVDLEQTQGQWTGTIDIPVQGLRGFDLGDLSVANGEVSFTMPNVPGDPAFTGKLGDGGKTMTGRFSQGGQTFPFSLERKPKTQTKGATPSKGIPGEGFAGVWQGSIKVNLFELRLLFNLSDNDGQLTGTIDSLDQNATGIAITDATVDGRDIHLEVQLIGGTYDGKLSEDGSEIDGLWQQGGQSLPLVMKRLAEAPDLSRPQDPTPPYPYAEEQVVFRNEGAGVDLAGTFTYPDSPGPHPAVVLISGSGPQDRDEAIMGHRPFLVLADHLTRHGVAVLRYDDRGFGESTGRFSEATTTDFTSDALTAVDFLKSRREVDAGRIGLIGHSEGGLVAPQAAVRSDDVGFIVLLAAPGVPLDALLARQASDMMNMMGMDAQISAKEREAQQEVFRIALEEGDSPDAAEQMRLVLTDLLQEYTPEQLEAMGYAEGQLDNQIETMLTPWFRELLRTDPRPTLEQVRCPVLAINGEKDIQVASQENLAGIQAALEKGGNEDFTVIEFPGLNHLFQRCTTGAITEYATIDETINPEVLATISDWIRDRTDRQ